MIFQKLTSVHANEREVFLNMALTGLIMPGLMTISSNKLEALLQTRVFHEASRSLTWGSDEGSLTAEPSLGSTATF